MKNLKLKLVCTLFLGLLLTSSFSIIQTAFAPSPGLTFKWEAKLGPYAQTYIAPLSVNVNGRTEIITTGSNQDYGTAGNVTALDGATGNIIWQVQPGGIGSHTPFEIADINNDGIPEILISAQGGALCLSAANGSTIWKNPNAPSEENYPAIADVNNDGYDECFVSRGFGPYQNSSTYPNGYDYITELSYNGTMLAQAWVWHPCWGGLTVGDPNFNGTFMLFCGDRSYAYAEDTDPYKNGGMGIRALNASNLVPLWNDSDILCSSQAPMLADVDKDGKLDVVVAWQPNGGMAVLNATTGAIDTTNGIYRANASLGLWDHSNPTIGEFDNSGDMEAITCQDSQPIIFDLYTWQKVATLPIICHEPPKAGHVTADGALDIIAISGLTDNATIFEFNNVTNQFVSVGNIPNPPNNTDLLHANAFSLVQDVDGDGLNELVVTTGDGNVICYDTPATASTRPVRTGYQFFSTRHDGVAEYVPPDGPIAPQIYYPSPQDGTTNVPITTNQLSFTLRDYEGNPFNYTVTTNPNVGVGGPFSVYNATFPTLPKQFTFPISGLQSNTAYTWTVAATDGKNASSQTYSFTTGTSPVQLKLTVSSAHDSPIPGVGDNLFSNGSSVTCSVTSPVVENNVSYTCTGWTGTGSVPPTGSAASTTFTITQNSTITWNWQVQYELLVGVSGSGTTNATGTTMYPSGTVVAVNATASNGWILNNWLFSGTGAGSANPYVITMNGNYNLTAVFVQLQPPQYASLVVRGLDNGIYYRIYNSSTDSWGSWSVLPGATLDSPAAAICNNKLYVVVRGLDGSSLWFGYVDLGTSSFSSWNLLSGSTSSPPTLSSNGTALALTVRGGNNRVYYRFYTIATQTWTGWSVLPSGATLDSPAASLVGNGLHIVVRGTDGSTQWYSNVNQTTGAFSGWTLLSGSTPSTPTLTANSTALALVVRGSDNRIYYRFYAIATKAWTGWTALPSGTTQGSPAATILQNTLYIVVRGSDGTSLWQSSINLGTSTFSDWRLLSGATPSKPTLTS